MNLIDVMGLGTVALRGICRLNVRFGSKADITAYQSFVTSNDEMGSQKPTQLCVRHGDPVQLVGRCPANWRRCQIIWRRCPTCLAMSAQLVGPTRVP